MKKCLTLIFSVGIVMAFAVNATAYYMTGGDAPSQALSDVVVDIVFAADTSGSMHDELTAISNKLQDVINNIDCPDCDAWIRARLMGITGTYTSGGAKFDEKVTTHSLQHGITVRFSSRSKNATINGTTCLVLELEFFSKWLRSSSK